VLVLLLVGFLAYHAFAVRHNRADLRAAVLPVEPHDRGYSVHVRVRNDGGETAENVRLQGRGRPPGTGSRRAPQSCTCRRTAPPRRS
jgi:uncharacterized protein (TIGR02588 family)